MLHETIFDIQEFLPSVFQLHASATAEPNNLISVINLTDLAIKRIIKMAKQISPFINMCQEDQIALLKGGCTELMILRSIISYNPEKNSWSVSIVLNVIAIIYIHFNVTPYCYCSICANHRIMLNFTCSYQAIDLIGSSEWMS